MKNTFIIFVLIFSSVVIIPPKSYSQFTCGGAMPSEEITPDGTCSNSSTSYTSKYNDLSYNIPDENTPIKTILVNINVFQKTNGTGNWEDIPDHIDRLNQVIDWVSDKYENTPYPTDPLPGVPYISDSKLRVELSGIYFYQDDDLWDELYFEPEIKDAIYDEDPSRLDQLNICITGGVCSASGRANYPSSTVFTQDSYIMTYHNEPNPVADWAFSLHLGHELGHNIQLGHTYNSETCVIGHPEFLDDVFGTDPCPTPPSGCDICYHDGGWDCDPNLSTNTCTNNMMGGTQAMGYLSPKQMGRIHRSLSIRSVRRYVKEMPKSETPLEITSDETWDFNIQLYSDIIVKSGATLTITCKVLMPPEGRIIVERNAKLIVDEGEITGAYETLWRGIEVWGNPNYAHDTPEPHGIVETKNGAIISNANHAITTTRKDENGSVVSGYHGGIIKADQTTFENNKRAAEFWPFAYENASYFTRCSFLTSEALFDNNEFDYFIIMSDIEGVTIQGCDFENTRPANDVYIEDRGIGIYSTECQFKIDEYDDPAGGNIENQFIALDYGIKAFGLTSSKAPDIRYCSFGFNRTGVYFSGITSGSVLLSDFQVEMFDQIYDQNIYCGLYLDNSTQYHIEANTFWHATNTPTTETHVIGITANNSGESNNEIYRNTFKALDVGILAQNNNRKTTEIIKVSTCSLTRTNIYCLLFYEGNSTYLASETKTSENGCQISTQQKHQGSSNGSMFLDLLKRLEKPTNTI